MASASAGVTAAPGIPGRPAAESPPVQGIPARQGGPRAYACLRDAEWNDMEWRLPVVLTSEMGLDFFMTADGAIDFAVVEYARDMATHITNVCKNTKKKPLPRLKRASSPPPRDFPDDSSEAPPSALRGAAADSLQTDLRGSQPGITVFNFDEKVDVGETLPESLERMCRHKWYVVRIPYDKTAFVNNSANLSMQLRTYVTLDESATFSPVSVPGPYLYVWGSINSVAEQAVRDRLEEKNAAKRRLVAEKEDRRPKRMKLL